MVPKHALSISSAVPSTRDRQDHRSGDWDVMDCMMNNSMLWTPSQHRTTACHLGRRIAGALPAFLTLPKSNTHLKPSAPFPVRRFQAPTARFINSAAATIAQPLRMRVLTSVAASAKLCGTQACNQRGSRRRYGSVTWRGGRREGDWDHALRLAGRRR